MGVKQMSWASYLFNDINEKSNPVTSLAPCTDEEIAKRISASTSLYTTESDEDTFKPDTVFECFHYQVRIPISDQALLAGFLMLWLKRCVVSTLLHEVIIADVVYPAVLLAHGKSISLLQAMVAGIQSGLRVLTKSLCQVEAIVDSQGRPVVDSEGKPEVKTPNPRVELPYTYLMAWYVMHCLSLMTAMSLSEGFVPFVRRLENSSWSQYYMYYIRKAILSSSNYQLDRYFPEISDASYGDKFANFAGPDDFTRLPSRVFWWLFNIQPGNLVFR